MAFEFKRAVREAVGLVIGFAGGTGSGKTMTALEVATGISGGKPFALLSIRRPDARSITPAITPSTTAICIRHSGRKPMRKRSLRQTMPSTRLSWSIL